MTDRASEMEDAACSEVPMICKNCGHDYIFHLDSVTLQVVYCDFEDQPEYSVCGCTSFELADLDTLHQMADSDD